MAPTPTKSVFDDASGCFVKTKIADHPALSIGKKRALSYQAIFSGNIQHLRTKFFVTKQRQSLVMLFQPTALRFLNSPLTENVAGSVGSANWVDGSSTIAVPS
jgi:hypothetical protein